MLPNNNNNNNNSSSSSGSSSSMDTSMDTSSSSNINKRPSEKQITKEDVNTEVDASNKEVDEAECPICLDPLGTENVKTLNKVAAKQKINNVETDIQVCGHSFHKKCIDNWINSTREQTGGPRCPVCRTEISRDQWPQQEPRIRGPTIVQQADAARPSIRAQAIQAEEREREQQGQGPVLFMGILVCLNGQPFRKKYLNSDTEFNLRTNNTLGELKAKILALAPELAKQRTFFCQTNMGRYINNALSYTGLTNERKPSFRITSMYYGTPYSCDKFSQLNIGNIPENMIRNNNSIDNIALIDIYKDYQNNIIYASDTLRNDRIEFSIFNSIYRTHTVRWRPTGPEDEGYQNTDYFYNFNNPEIPEEFRARPRFEGELTDFQYERTTRHPLAWLVVNIECNTLTYKIDNNAGLVTNTLEEPGGGGQVPLANSRIGGRRKTKNRHYKHKKSVRKTSGKNKKSIRRRTKQHKKSVRK